MYIEHIQAAEIILLFQSQADLIKTVHELHTFFE